MASNADMTADDVIRLMEAAKRMGIQTVRVGNFAFDFSAESGPFHGPPQSTNPLDDPDMWLGVRAGSR